ncbi:MAG TPA: hypothetical protein VGB52_05445 [Actinomycetota bacterium]
MKAIDQAGNPSNDATYGPIKIDGTGPNAPTITSLTHSQDDWSSNRDASFAWAPPLDGSMIDGYSVLFDQNASTDPDETVDTVTTGWTQSGIADGEWWLHVRGKDAANNWGATGHYRVRVDATGPVGPVISSPTHPNEDGAYTGDSPQFDWVPPSELSGISGYSFVLDNSPDTIPDTTSEGSDTSMSYTDLHWGEYWFHVRAQNGSHDAAGEGLWGDTAHFHVMMFPLADASAASAPDQGGPGVSVTPTALADEVSTVSPGLQGPGNLFPIGGLLGSDSFFGGTVVPDGNIVEAVADAYGSLFLPEATLGNLGDGLSGSLGAVRAGPSLPLIFQLVPGAGYTVTTTRYEPDGTTRTRTDNFSSCVPHSYSSADGELTLEPDLSIYLCPDISAFPSQRLDYRLNALRSGVRVKVGVTMNLVTKELAFSTDARTSDHPTSFGMTLTQTTDAATSTSSNVLDTSSTALLDSLDLTVTSTPPTGSRAAEGHVRVTNIPAAVTHRYTISGKEATDTDRTISLRLALENNAPNPGEQLFVERLDSSDGGRLTGRLDMQNVPRDFDMTIDGILKPEGDVRTATPIQATIRGTQSASVNEMMQLQQWNGAQLLSILDASSFASEYEIGITVLRDEFGAQLKDTGGALSASFPAGPPAGGVLQLSRYRRVGQTDVLDSRFDFENFSTLTEFRVRAHGDPDDPTGTEISLENLAGVPNQLIQVLRYPVNASPQRFVLAGPSADQSAIYAPVDGRNLRWDAIPRKFDFVTDLTRQPNRMPATIAIDIQSTSATPNGRIEVTEKQPDGTLGFILKAFNARTRLEGTFQGTLTNPKRARIARSNFGSRSDQALQVYLKDGATLETQVRFMGPEATTEDLESGAGTEVDGIFTSVPDDYDYDMTLTTDAQGHPTDATLTGSNSAAAANMDVVFSDNRKGIQLHQHALPKSFSYVVHAENFDSGGNPKLMRLAATSQSSANANAVLEAKYRSLHLLLKGLTETFSYDVSVTGPIDNPATATISQRQSDPNPNQLVQMVLEQDTSQRLAVTLKNRPDSVLPETASYMDLVWSSVPQDFDVTVGRSQSDDGAHANVTVDTHGADLPEATVRLRQHRPNQRQELYLKGLSATLSGSLRYGGSLGDPNTLQVQLQSSGRHDTDAFQALSYTGSDLEASIVAKAGAAVPPISASGSRLKAVYDFLPPGVTLQYTNTKDENGHETAFSAVLHNTDASGNDAPNPSGAINLEFFDGNGVPTRTIRATDLPAVLTQLKYTFPPPNPNENDNCLGRIGYEGSSSTLDLELDLFVPRGCFAGRVTANIADVPHLGFEKAELLRSGDATFLTRMDGAAREVVTKAVIEAPVPDDVAQFLNKPIDFDQGHAKQLCPAVGSFAGRGVGCMDVRITANPSYDNVRVRLEADGLRSAQLKSNLGLNGTTKRPYPSGFDDIDRDLWDLLPLFAVRNDGTGSIKVFLSGDDNPNVTSTLHQEARCCVRTWKTAGDEMDYSLDKPLGLRFYAWQVESGHCGTDSDQSLSKCNLDGEELTNTFGANIHAHPPEPFYSDEPVPFDPKFIAFSYDENPEEQRNGFLSNPGTTTYYVPNLYDTFLSDGPSARWYAHNLAGWQTDWYFHSLLREYEVDPFGLGA